MLTNLKSIAFIVGETQHETSSGLADRAATLAQLHGAHLIGIYRASSSRPSDGSYVRGTAAMHDVASRIARHREEQALIISRHIAELSRKHGISAEFRIVWSDHVEQDIVTHSLHCDLVVMGHPLPSGWPGSWLPENILAASGIPVLIIPERWHRDHIGERVMLAWNGSREARRGITDAMPFIANAESVIVLIVDADRHPRQHGPEPGSDIAAYLARHSTDVIVDRIASDGSPVAEAILDHAIASDVDLLVIGAYSHARMIQRLVGGVTETLLHEVPVPLLLSM